MLLRAGWEILVDWVEKEEGKGEGRGRGGYFLSRDGGEGRGCVDAWTGQR